MEERVLALYDFASKQKYIYRTSKIREISGASQLLSSAYGEFIATARENGISFKCDLDSKFDVNSFDSDAEVLYEGGGNLMVLYRDEATYLKTNEIISRKLLEEHPTLKLISCKVSYTGNFESDRAKLYRENGLRKNQAAEEDITAVIPFVQVDPMTFLPVVHKAKDESLSADRVDKRLSYRKNSSDDLEGLEGLTAVIYIDGNSMGKKLMKLNSEDYNTGVNNLRDFSRKTNRVYVETPLEEFDRFIKNSDSKGYRKVIGGGDEITIICDAKIAMKLVELYFKSLEESNNGIQNEEDKNYSCAGISVFHAKTPFSIVYELAEAACESAKKRAHAKNGNYFDFYYCHAGVTAGFDTLREQEQKMTARPYEFKFFKETVKPLAEMLRRAGRSNVKDLGNAAQLGKEKYAFEVERVNSYLKKNDLKPDDDKQMRLVYDISEFYDIWFGEEDEQK